MLNIFDTELTSTKQHQFDVGVQTIRPEAADVSDVMHVCIETSKIQDQGDCKHCHTIDPESSGEESPAKHRKFERTIDSE